MLVSHRKKFIFTKTAKTAGTSVEVFFEKYCFPEGQWEFQHLREEYNGPTGIVGYRGYKPDDAQFWNHMSAARIRQSVGEDVWSSYFKFTVIRDPFDKLVSAFYHLEKHNNAEKYADDNKSDIDRFREWLKLGGKPIDRETYLIDNQVCLDFFIRYESLLQDVARVCEKIGVPFRASDFPALKAEHRDRSVELADFYDQESEDVVKRLYAFELDHFDYRTPRRAAA